MEPAQLHRADSTDSRGSFSLPLVSGVGYLPFGPVSSITFGNGQVLQKAWDQNYWPDAVQSPAIDYDFSTNDVGNITQVSSAAEGTQNLGYDRLDRLSEVRDQNLALIESFTYDDTGNRRTQTVGATTTAYTYPTTSHRLSQVGSVVRTYDAVGNSLTGIPGYETQAATYDARNRLTQVGSGTSAQLRNQYNGRGERVLTSQGNPAPALPTKANGWNTAGIRSTLYDEAGQVLSSLRSGSAQTFEEIVWIDNIPVGRVESSTTAVTSVHAIHSDHLNSPRALVNAQTQSGQAAGTVVWRWRLNVASASGSNAFGAQAASEDPDGNGTAVRFDLRFPGQQLDAVTGLNYNYFRDYEPGTGRYVESDPIGLKGGVSTYGYVRGQPLRRRDPLGLDDGFGAPLLDESESKCEGKCSSQIVTHHFATQEDADFANWSAGFQADVICAAAGALMLGASGGAITTGDAVVGFFTDVGCSVFLNPNPIHPGDELQFEIRQCIDSGGRWDFEILNMRIIPGPTPAGVRISKH